MTLVERSIDFAAPAERVWEIVGDVASAAACLPGLTVGAALGEGRFSAQMSVTVGLLSLLYTGRLTVREIDRDRRRVRFGVDGAAFGGLTLSVAISAEVAARDAGTSRLAIINDIRLDAATTLMAGPMIAPVGAQLLEGFARNIRPLVARAGTPLAP